MNNVVHRTLWLRFTFFEALVKKKFFFPKWDKYEIYCFLILLLVRIYASKQNIEASVMSNVAYGQYFIIQVKEIFFTFKEM